MCDCASTISSVNEPSVLRFRPWFRRWLGLCTLIRTQQMPPNCSDFSATAARRSRDNNEDASEITVRSQVSNHRAIFLPDRVADLRWSNTIQCNQMQSNSIADNAREIGCYGQNGPINDLVEALKTHTATIAKLCKHCDCLWGIKFLSQNSSINELFRKKLFASQAVFYCFTRVIRINLVK